MRTLSWEMYTRFSPHLKNKEQGHLENQDADVRVDNTVTNGRKWWSGCELAWGKVKWRIFFNILRKFAVNYYESFKLRLLS
jgi:hypothetical protein